MRQVKDFPFIEGAVSPQQFTIKQVEIFGKREIPDDWADRCARAELAFEAMEDTTLDDHIDPDIIENRFSGVCGPDDDTLETFLDGDATVIDQLCLHIDHAKAALEVLAAFRYGDLAELLQV